MKKLNLKKTKEAIKLQKHLCQICNKQPAKVIARRMYLCYRCKENLILHPTKTDSDKLGGVLFRKVLKGGSESND